MADAGARDRLVTKEASVSFLKKKPKNFHSFEVDPSASNE
jgi:hypothetical protein